MLKMQKKPESPPTSKEHREIHTCKQHIYIHTQIGWYKVLASFFPLYLKTQVWFPVYHLLILNKQATSVKTE